MNLAEVRAVVTGGVSGIGAKSAAVLLAHFGTMDALLERIDNDDPTALVGLPLIRTARLLRAAGLVLP